MPLQTRAPVFSIGQFHFMNIGALCAASPEALPHSPSQMPLSCSVAPASQRELHKDGGGGGVAGRARAARAPKAKSCATSCGTSSATPCAASLTCPSFTCRPRKAWGAVEDGACHNERLWQMTMGKINTFAMNNFTFPSFAAPNTSSATSCVKLFSCVLHVSPKGRPGVGSVADR